MPARISSPRLGEHLARCVDRERVVARSRKLVDRGQIAQLHAKPRYVPPTAEVIASLSG